jgi:uncharacterized membrane protein YhiD involved in acid resistance
MPQDPMNLRNIAIVAVAAIFIVIWIISNIETEGDRRRKKEEVDRKVIDNARKRAEYRRTAKDRLESRRERFRKIKRDRS